MSTPRFTLRTMLILIAGIACVLGVHFNRGSASRRAIDHVESAGGLVLFDWQKPTIESRQPRVWLSYVGANNRPKDWVAWDASASSPDSGFVQTILGDDVRDKVHTLAVPVDAFTELDLKVISQFSNLECIAVTGFWVSSDVIRQANAAGGVTTEGLATLMEPQSQKAALLEQQLDIEVRFSVNLPKTPR